jgi:predicted P-loop ATPase
MLMSPSRSQRRLDDLQRSLEEYGKVKQSFLIARESDLRAMESKFNLFGNKDEARAKMSEQIESIRASLDTTDVALTGYVRQVAEQNRLNPCEQGMQVIVSVDKSKRVTKVYRATPALTT